MMGLKDAYRQIGFTCKHFMTRKRSNQPQDLFCLERAYQESGGMASIVQFQGQRQIEEVIKDKSITKDYYSDEIQKSKRYLGLMQLGIEYLNMTVQFEDMKEAHEIMYERVQKEIGLTLNNPTEKQG